MGKLNLLKGSYDGKVGATVGAKWKSISTIRSYAKPAYTDTPEQQIIRGVFGDITHFISVFADSVKSYNTLDTRSMSYRNAIIHESRQFFSDGVFSPAGLIISRGGLPLASSFTASVPAGLITLSASWTPAVGNTLTGKAKVVVVAVDSTHDIGYVGADLNTAGTLSISGTFYPSTRLDLYYYTYDVHAGRRVGSKTAYTSITTPSA